MVVLYCVQFFSEVNISESKLKSIENKLKSIEIN